jgi:hypothetical protein
VYDIKDFKLLPADPKQVGVIPRELEMALQLIDDMTEHWARTRITTRSARRSWHSSNAR